MLNLVYDSMFLLRELCSTLCSSVTVSPYRLRVGQVLLRRRTRRWTLHIWIYRCTSG